MIKPVKVKRAANDDHQHRHRGRCNGLRGIGRVYPKKVRENDFCTEAFNDFKDFKKQDEAGEEAKELKLCARVRVVSWVTEFITDIERYKENRNEI